jgi:hypothetical protein
MFELLTLAIFLWLFVKAIGFAFRLTWGIAKIAASILIGLALPVLILCLIFAGGVLLLVPLVMLAIAAGILKACL